MPNNFERLPPTFFLFFVIKISVDFRRNALTISGDLPQHSFCFSLLKLVLTSGGIAHHFFCFIFHHQKQC